MPGLSWVLATLTVSLSGGGVQKGVGAGAPKLELTRARSWDLGKLEQTQQPAVYPASLFLMLPAVVWKELSLNEEAGR